MNDMRNGYSIAVWLGLATFASSMLFVWQGLDFTDMGFWITPYQQLYTHPEAIPASCWLSNVIGHWVGLAFGGGIIAYKLGYVIVVTMSALIAYRLLATEIGNSRMLAAMVLLTVFFTRGFGGNWIDYNNLTALFYLAGAALLFFGLVDNRKLLLVFAGIVLGANVFIRFPNLLGITLISAIWLKGWIYGWTWRNILIESACFLCGFVIGTGLIWGLIVLHGHKAIYFQGMQELFNLAVNSSSHHPGSGLAKQFITDHIKALAQAFAFVVIVSCIASWTTRQKILLASAVTLACALLLAYFIYVRENWRWFVPGICYVVLLAIVFLESRKNRSFAVLAFIAAMVLLLAPLGSNNGITNSVFGMWLALPLALTWLWQRSPNLSVSLCFKASGDELESNGKFSMDARGFRVFAMVIVSALMFQSLISAWRHTYLDSKNRFAMTHSIEHRLLAGTYTTADRAKVVTELLDAMSHFAKPGDEVLVYNAIPTVHFLTETHPWLGNPWLDFDDAKKIERLIRQKEKKGAKMPIIVRATGSTYANNWPMEAQPLATFWDQDKPRRVFEEFEQRHGYVVAWSNDFFEILVIPSNNLNP